MVYATVSHKSLCIPWVAWEKPDHCRNLPRTIGRQEKSGFRLRCYKTQLLASMEGKRSQSFLWNSLTIADFAFPGETSIHQSFPADLTDPWNSPGESHRDQGPVAR